VEVQGMGMLVEMVGMDGVLEVVVVRLEV